jgi:protocatechuate 3,4-dioxygenase beta subunit
MVRRLAHLRAVLLALIGLAYVATWPGATLRAPAVFELVAPAVPRSVTGRDGVLDVLVWTAGRAAPLPGARVKAFAVLDGRAHAAGEATADAEGRATLRDLPEAEHWIAAEHPGHARASQMVVVVAGARRLDLELGPEHTLDVDVKDERGAPLAGAELEVRGSDPFPVGARTDGAGHATVRRLGEGPYTVSARAPGFEEVTRRRVQGGEPLAIVLGKQGALLVAVAGQDGAPAAGARVLVGSPALGSTRVASAGADGKVRIAGLDAGSYALRAVSGSQVSPIELGLALARGEERDVKLTLGPGRMIAVHVVDAATEDDVRDARLTLAEGGLSPFPSDGVTDRHGRVVLGPIARGPATLSARADGFVAKAAIAVADDAPAELRVALARGGALVGKVTDARGYAVDGATVRVVGTDAEGMPVDEDPSRASFREAHFEAQLKGPSPLVPAGELGVMPGPVPAIPHGAFAGGGAPPVAAAGTPARAEPWVTGRDGTFRAGPVPPGRLRALVHHPQYVEAMSEVVLVESNGEARVEVVLLRGGSLEGRVLDARGRSVPGAHVTVLATRGSLEHMTRSGTDGSFAFAALPDAVTVLVARDEDPTTIVARVEVAVPEAGKKTIAITLPEPRPALPVKVTDRRGAIDGAQISAVSLDASEALRVTAFSDPRGRAELAGARGIAARVEVQAPGHAPRVITTTPETAELAVELAAAESLTGEVTTRRREPLAGAEITLQTEAGVRHARTNRDGVFTIGEVPAGSARLRVRLAGRAPEERAIALEAREGRRPTELPRIELLEEGVVEGTVIDARGDPIAGARVARDAVPTYLPVGVTPTGMAVTDAKGRFRLGELAEGDATLEAFAADVGRARRSGVRVHAGRTTSDVKLVITRGEAGAKEPMATGGVAVTLGETAPGPDGAEVVIVAVSEGSEAERAGLAAGDVISEIGGAKVATIADARARLSGPVHDDVLVKLRRGERALTLRVAREAVRR